MAIVTSGPRSEKTEEVLERASRAAAGFASLGVGRGDTVAVYLRNDFPFLEASIGAGLIGAYPVPVNWHYTEDEARYLFENSGAKAIVIHADLLAGIETAIPEEVPVIVVATPPEIRAAYGISGDFARVPRGSEEWSAWTSRFSPRVQVLEPPGTIIYTSGTTGRPKGVRRTPPTPDQVANTGAILGRGFGFAPWMNDPAQMTVAVVGPMYHSAPNAYGLASTRLGANVILEPRFDA